MEQKLIHGDCLEQMRAMPPESVDVTSPPYNLGIRYGRFDVHIPADTQF